MEDLRFPNRPAGSVDLGDGFYLVDENDGWIQRVFREREGGEPDEPIILAGWGAPVVELLRVVIQEKKRRGVSQE